MHTVNPNSRGHALKFAGVIDNKYSISVIHPFH